MKVSSQFATSHFDELLDAIDRGEEVEILRTGKPRLHLVPDSTSVTDSGAKPKEDRVLGAGRGELHVPGVAEWAAMDKELERLMNDSPLLPSEHS